MGKFNKTMISTMVAAALGVPASAGAFTLTFSFDQTGAGGPAVVFNEITWSGGNAILTNLVNGGTKPLFGSTVSAVSGDMHAQAIASNIGAGNPGCSGAQCTYFFTYQFDIPVTGTQTLTSTGLANMLSLNGTGTLGTFKIFANTVAPNTSAGTGYGPGILVLSGGATLDPGNPLSLLQTNAQAAPFSGSTGTDLGTVGDVTTRSVDTVALTGSANLVIDATFANPSFFKSDVTTLLLDLSLGATANTTADATMSPQGLSAPFGASIPVNASVAGNVANFGVNGLNDFYCTSGATVTCDMQVSTSGGTIFKSVPEPDSLALLGLSMGVLGFGLRKRRKAA